MMWRGLAAQIRDGVKDALSASFLGSSGSFMSVKGCIYFKDDVIIDQIRPEDRVMSSMSSRGRVNGWEMFEQDFLQGYN